MDFIDRIKDLASKVPSQLAHVETEEATKNALVMPFIAALGYNVFDPSEVVPEFTADVGVKKGEKVDYAILQDGKPIILFECKHAGVDLASSHMSQLYRYFSVTDARIGVLTNGLSYEFYSDLDAPNRMDERPFLEIDMQALNESLIPELKRLARGSFDVEEIVSAAGELKYSRALRRYLTQEFAMPNDEFMSFLVRQVYSGRLTENVKGEFTPIVKRALRQFLNDQVNRRLRSAIVEEETPAEATAPAESAEQEPVDDGGIVTTEEEVEAYLIVKAILREVIDPSRIAMRDRMSYCGILLDDNNRQPITRLFFGTSQRYIGLFDKDKNVTRVPIESLNDIYTHAETLKATALNYSD